MLLSVKPCHFQSAVWPGQEQENVSRTLHPFRDVWAVQVVMPKPAGVVVSDFWTWTSKSKGGRDAGGEEAGDTGRAQRVDSVLRTGLNKSLKYFEGFLTEKSFLLVLVLLVFVSS